MKIHIISNSLFMNSGYSNVAKYLGLGLQKLGHSVSMTGMQTAYEIDNRYGITQYPIQTNIIDETGQILMNIRTVNPDVVICIFQSDEPSLNHIPSLFKKTIWYTTIEGARVPSYTMREFINVIDNGGKIVVPSIFGYDEIEKEWKEWVKLHLGDRIGNRMIHVIPYGYDDKVFRPIDIDSSDKTEIVSFLKWDKRDDLDVIGWSQYNVVLGDMLRDPSFKGKFVYGQVGQNFGIRKRFERLLKAYSILLSDSQMLKDRTMLHLHAFPVSDLRINLMDECERLGIQKNVTFSYGDYRSSGWSENSLNILMNRFDCHCSASSGEGYSLPCLETMACGVPNIAPRFTSFPELIGDENMEERLSASAASWQTGAIASRARGLLAELDTIQMTQTTSYKGLVNENDLASKMKEMYNNKELRERYRKNCLSFVKDRTWDQVILKWDNLLKTFV